MRTEEEIREKINELAKENDERLIGMLRYPRGSDDLKDASQNWLLANHGIHWLQWVLGEK